ncbi:hypothetical protein FSP39_014509 [Pinctada imbricata]|uniref:B box-type domain-containing protein n=1 Tax=Pinctada imbricata TaxID=66713 RepID=A0AA89BU01_PINIB|nr:hypothetical protein FSP39_014509 [Pinctada imbricata]
MATALTSQLRCELCGSRKSSEWKCYECSQIMCKRCKKLHVKANISKYHNFVSLKQSREESKDRCPNHPSETCTKECTTCGQFVCDVCIQQKHRGHQVLFVQQEITEMREMCRRNLSDVKEIGLSIALKEMETFRQLGDDYKAKTQELLKEVTSRYSAWVAMAKDIQNDLLQQIQSVYKLDMGYYETEGKLRQNLILEMEDVIQNFQEGNIGGHEGHQRPPQTEGNQQENGGDDDASTCSGETPPYA